MQPEIHNESVKHTQKILGMYLLVCTTHLATFRVAEGSIPWHSAFAEHFLYLQQISHLATLSPLAEFLLAHNKTLQEYQQDLSLYLKVKGYFCNFVLP